MDTGATPQGGRDADGRGDTDGSGGEPGPPPAPDRAFVDGTARSSEEIREEVRSEVEVLDDERLRRVEELREEVAATVGELSRRMDVPARLRAGKNDTLAVVQRRAERASALMADAVSRVTRERRRAVATSVGVLLLALLAGCTYAARRPRGSSIVGTVIPSPRPR